jgi:hypothetical protein
MGFVSENFGFRAAYALILIVLALATFLFIKINRKVVI